MNEKDANPFTLPVAVLLYRVAKNLLQKSSRSQPRKISGTIYRLLTHCLDLLDAEKFPQVNLKIFLAFSFFWYFKINFVQGLRFGALFIGQFIHNMRPTDGRR